MVAPTRERSRSQRPVAVIQCVFAEQTSEASVHGERQPYEITMGEVWRGRCVSPSMAGRAQSRLKPGLNDYLRRPITTGAIFMSHGKKDGGKGYGSSLRFSRVLLPLLGAAMIMTGCGPVAHKAVNPDEIVRDIEQKSYLVRQFRADFVKTRHATVFDRDLTVKGSLVYQKPNRFRLVLSGDVHVEIVSDGSRITLIHDVQDFETHEIQGDRDMSRFADPLLGLIQSLSKGGLRQFSVVSRGEQDGLITLSREPVGDSHFERVKEVLLTLSEDGELRKVKIGFTEGDWDEIVFRSWRALTQQDPELRQLEEALSSGVEQVPAG
jgi:outer membrane lipoprotein-sorting protein